MSEERKKGEVESASAKASPVIGWPEFRAWLLRALPGIDDGSVLQLRELDSGDYVLLTGTSSGFEARAVVAVGAARRVGPREPELVAGLDALGWLASELHLHQGRVHRKDLWGVSEEAIADLVLATLRRPLGAIEPLRIHRSAGTRWSEPVELPPIFEEDPSQRAAPRTVVKRGHRFQFWDGDHRGLIRRRDGYCHPEIWKNGRWVYGSAYVLDAITGMGEDPYSCGEWAFDLTVPEAEAQAAKESIDLYAPNADDGPGET